MAVPLAVAASGAIVVAVVGARLTEIGPWYRTLKMPAWKPPDWAFGPIWTTIFALCTWSAARAWSNAPPGERSIVVVLFAINGLLNMAWSGLFFTLKRPDLALLEVVFLWLSIAVMIWRLRPIDELASLLLVPYLVWVTIASALTFAVVRLNR
jgi:tryptophan-rich sensory protein